MEPILEYFLYRGPDTTNDQIIKAIVEATKDYVFDENSIVLTSKGLMPIIGLALFIVRVQWNSSKREKFIRR